jgi:hypothetical protein
MLVPGDVFLVSVDVVRVCRKPFVEAEPPSLGVDEEIPVPLRLVEGLQVAMGDARAVTHERVRFGVDDVREVFPYRSIRFPLFDPFSIFTLSKKTMDLYPGKVK